MDKKSKLPDRRQFIGDAAALGLMGAMGAGYVLSSCKTEKPKYETPVFPERVPVKSRTDWLRWQGNRGCG